MNESSSRSSKRPGAFFTVYITILLAGFCWLAACTPAPDQVADPPPAPGKAPDPAAPREDAETPAPEKVKAPLAPEKVKAPPAGSTDTSRVTLLYTINNMGYTGTCG